MSIRNPLDTYGWQARLQPALLALLPLFISIAIWVPALYQVAVGLLGVIIACGVTVLLAHFARTRGRKLEAGLYVEWGGKPTTIWLRHRDRNLDAHTKRRYFAFLEERVREWKAPTELEERTNPEAADDRYDTAVRWFLEHARDRKQFPQVFKELVSYGFRRNLLGLKPFGLSIAIICTAVNAGAIFADFHSEAATIHFVGLASLAISLLAVAAWLSVVTRPWVRDAADAYAKALLAVCDRD